MKIILLNKKTEPAYRQFVKNHPQATIYHTLEWRDVIANTYQFAPYYLIALENKRVLGVLPFFIVETTLRGKRLVSLPFTPFVEPLFTKDQEILQFLRTIATKVRQEDCQYTQLKFKKMVNGLENICLNKETVLELNHPLKRIKKQFHKSVARAIRKAEKYLKIQPGKTLKDYNHFYELELETRKRQGAPIYPQSFFVNIYRLLQKNNLAKLFLAYDRNVPIAGIITFTYNRQTIYAYGASKSEKEYLRKRPNNLLLWHAIKEAHCQKSRVFDFGTTPVYLKGLLRFKDHWGGKTSKVYYQYLSTNKQIPTIKRDSLSMKITGTILKHSPKILLRQIGPLLIKEAA